MANESIGNFTFPKLNISDVINLEPIKNFLSTALTITAIILAIYVIFKIIGWARNYSRDKRIKLTFQNTEEIKSRLDKIEKKIDEIGKKPKTEKQGKEKHEKKK